MTTNDFVVIDKKTDDPVSNSQEIIQRLFKPDSITNDGILILVLLPHYNKSEKPDEIDMDIEFDIGSAVENSCWNVVCKSVFEISKISIV